MNTYWMMAFAGDVSVIRKVEAGSMKEAQALAERYCRATAKVLSEPYQLTGVYTEYPESYVLNKVYVSDLEFLSRRMKEGS